jgi:LAO/AO transport system kinase
MSQTLPLESEILNGSRVALAKAITLVESTREDHRLAAEDLLSRLLPHTGNALRIAISGPPGVGKSSFIEALGLQLVSDGHKVAVLAIDPSSPITGGSILGDKTRMEELARSERCFIRPSPSSGALGGVARHTREALLLCEAAGFNVVLIETVGIGQSEVMAASMTDLFVQLHQPLSGDELQGIKKGVMELADLVIVTKADGPTLQAAQIAKLDLERAVSLTRSSSEDQPPVILTSAHQKSGLKDAWDLLQSMHDMRLKDGRLTRRRTMQSKQWLNQEIETALWDLLKSQRQYETLLAATSQRVVESNEHCGRAARLLVHALLSPKR